MRKCGATAGTVRRHQRLDAESPCTSTTGGLSVRPRRPRSGGGTRNADSTRPTPALLYGPAHHGHTGASRSPHGRTNSHSGWAQRKIPRENDAHHGPQARRLLRGRDRRRVAGAPAQRTRLAPQPETGRALVERTGPNRFTLHQVHNGLVEMRNAPCPTAPTGGHPAVTKRGALRSVMRCLRSVEAAVVTR